MKIFTWGLDAAIVVILAGAIVTHFWGESGQMHLERYSQSSQITLEDGGEAQLPFQLRLEKFSIDYYPGSEMPMDYRSEVTVLPDGEKRTISMNHILRWKGYRFLQADYDPDLQGSILAVSHDPWGIGITYAGYILLLVSMIGFFFEKGTGFRAVARRFADVPRWAKVTLTVAGALLLAGCFWMICRRLLFQPLMPVLRSPLLWIHVAGMIICYSIFALVTVNGIAGLVAKRRETKDLLRDVSLTFLYPAVFLMAFGTFIGAVWANISWGSYWSWDPKETWALVTLIVYGFALHGKTIKPLERPVVFHIFVILAFLCVLVTYFGVNYILGGMHSYA